MPLARQNIAILLIYRLKSNKNNYLLKRRAMEKIPLLRVENLTKEFGSHRVLNNISFNLQKGEILGLLGSNGAGKTTTIQMLLSIMQPTSGSIYYFGQNLAHHRTEIMRQVSFASTYVNLPGKLTIYENLDIYGQLYSIPNLQRKENIKQLLSFFGMWDARDKRTSTLSAGQMTRVMLAKAFLTDPRIVLLDEPTASLDPDIAADVRSFIMSQQKEKGVSVLLTSHNMDEVSEICERVLVLKNGSIIADSSPQKLAASVSYIRIHLTITTPLQGAYNFFNQEKIIYSQDRNYTVIELEESMIAHVLAQCAQKNIQYSYISIEKPTLEDYFLQVARKA